MKRERGPIEKLVALGRLIDTPEKVAALRALASVVGTTAAKDAVAATISGEGKPRLPKYNGGGVV